MTKKDDLYSLLFTIWWLYNDMNLKWEDSPRLDQERQKKELTEDILCDMDVDDDFYEFVKYIFTLDPEDQPNFKLMKNMITKIFEKYAVPVNINPCWSKTSPNVVPDA